MTARKPRGVAHTRGVVLGWVIPHLAAYLTHNGFDPSPVLRLPGIRERDFGDPDVRVPDSAVREAWRLATEITADDALGLHVAESLPRGALDLVEYAFRSSSTLAVGLDRLARYGRLINDRIAARALDMGPGFRIFLGFGAEQPVHPQRAEFALAMTCALLETRRRWNWHPIDVSFAHAAPQDLQEHRRFFRAPLHFSAVSMPWPSGSRRTAAAAVGRQGTLRDRAEAARQGPGRARPGHRRLDGIARTKSADRRDGTGSDVDRRDRTRDGPELAHAQPASARGRDIIPRPFAMRSGVTSLRPCWSIPRSAWRTSPSSSAIQNPRRSTGPSSDGRARRRRSIGASNWPAEVRIEN